MTPRAQLVLLLIGPVVIALAADISFHRLIGLQSIEAQEASRNDAELTAFSLRALLGRIEEEAMRGSSANVTSWRQAEPPRMSFGKGFEWPFLQRSDEVLRELALSEEATNSGLPVAVLAAIALGDPLVLEDVNDRLLRGDLPVRLEDLEGLAELLSISDRARLDDLEARLRGIPRYLPSYPGFERNFENERVTGWSRIGGDVLHYEVRIEVLLRRAAIDGNVHVTDDGVEIPDLAGLRISVDPERKGMLLLWGLRVVVWLAMACILAGFIGYIRGQRREREALEREHALLASVSHELRTPLASIRLFGDSLADGQDQATEYGQLISLEAERLEEMLDRILTAARTLEAPRFDEVDPETVMRSAVDLMEARARRQSVSLIAETRSELPACLWDREAVKGALVNLLDNAIRHGGSDRRVEIRAVSDGDEVRFSVKDEGLGIGTSEGRRLFERFRRGSSHASGSGLGLYLVEQTAKAHGGSVDFESEAGRGSVFHLVLPVRAGMSVGDRRS